MSSGVTPQPYLPATVQPVRVVVWLAHLALPMAGLWLLLANPGADVLWHHPPSHFGLVLGVAALNVGMGVWVATAAGRRADARLFLVALTFLSSAGFLLLHALATPGILLPLANVGFDLSQPVGLTLGAVFGLAASLPLDGALGTAVLRRRWWILSGLGLLMAGWATVSLLDLPPLNRPPGVRDLEGPQLVLAGVAVVLYLVAAWRLLLLHRRRPSAVLVSVLTAFVLLAEAMVAVSLADKWHLSWWEWHLLLAFAFGFVAYSAYVQYRREGGSAGVFDAIALERTTRRLRAEYAAALEELVAALQIPGRAGPVAARVAARFGLTEGQAAVLERAGAALSTERDLSRRLGALVAVGERARVGLGAEEFLREAMQRLAPAYGELRVGLVHDGVAAVGGRRYAPAGWAGPIDDGDRLVYPLTVSGRAAGVLVAPRYAGAGQPGAALLATLANQLSIAIENARLYGELHTLFRRFLSPDVAAALLADPDQAALGGSVVEVTALFADLRGFTTFSEGVEPAAIVTMLNRYHGVAVPCILDAGGTVVQFVGDAILALFNAPARQVDHAARAVRAALAMQRAVTEIAAERPDWPRFRVGLNTGPALVGNIGAESLRGFNAMGDAVNVAARLQALAEPGDVVIGESTRIAAGPGLLVRPLGDLMVKGRAGPVRAYVASALR